MPKIMKGLTKLGIALTVGWVLVFSVVICFHVSDAAAMTLNEWGDFLAGASAPLALLWLVIGYFQHGQELHLNTRALETQQEELRRQVEETARLAEAADRQALVAQQDLQDRRLREGKDAAPEFVSHGGSTSGAKIATNLLNRGGEARQTELIYDGPHDLYFEGSTDQLIWEKGDKVTLVLRQEKNSRLEYPVKFHIKCIDRLNYVHNMGFAQDNGHKLTKVSHDKMPKTEGV